MFNGPIYVSLLPIQCHDTFCLILFYMYGMMIRVLHSVKMCMSRMLFHFMRCECDAVPRKATVKARISEKISRDFHRRIRIMLTSIAQYTLIIHYLMRSFRGAYLFSVVFNVYARFYSFPWIINLNHLVCMPLSLYPPANRPAVSSDACGFQDYWVFSHPKRGEQTSKREETHP